MAPLLPSMLSFSRPHAGGRGPHPSQFCPSPQRRAQFRCQPVKENGIQVFLDVGNGIRAWLWAELVRRRGPRWSQGCHPGRGCGPRRDRGVAYEGWGWDLPKLEASSPLSQHSPPPPRPSHCGRPGVLPALAFSPIARQTDGREAPGPT